MILFSQYLSNVPVPCLTYRDGRLRLTQFHLFQLFPVLLTISLMWGLCAVLTVTDVLPEASEARTDTKMEIIHRADWFRCPYPCELIVNQVSVPFSTASSCFSPVGQAHGECGRGVRYSRRGPRLGHRECGRLLRLRQAVRWVSRYLALASAIVSAAT